MEKLDYFKSKLIEILDEQIKKIENPVKKSFTEIILEIKKSGYDRSKLVEKIITDKNGHKRKVWINPNYVNNLKKYTNTDSNGAKIAIGKLKKQISKCETPGELLAIVKRNRGRFRDQNGKMLPIVKELWKYTQDRKKELIKLGIVEKNKNGRFVFDDFRELTEEQQQYVINDLLNRNYNMVSPGIYAETSRKSQVGSAVYSKELKDCQILKMLGFDEIYILPQKYVSRVNGKDGNHCDTFVFRNGDKYDFIELKNLDKSTISTLKDNYLKSLNQAKNVFIEYNEPITDDEIIIALNEAINNKKGFRKKANLPPKDFSGLVFIYKTIENVILIIDVKKEGLEEESSSPFGGISSQSLTESGRISRHSLSNINIQDVDIIVNKKSEKSVKTECKTVKDLQKYAKENYNIDVVYHGSAKTDSEQCIKSFFEVEKMCKKLPGLNEYIKTVEYINLGERNNGLYEPNEYKIKIGNFKENVEFEDFQFATGQDVTTVMQHEMTHAIQQYIFMNSDDEDFRDMFENTKQGDKFIKRYRARYGNFEDYKFNQPESYDVQKYKFYKNKISKEIMKKAFAKLGMDPIKFGEKKSVWNYVEKNPETGKYHYDKTRFTEEEKAVLGVSFYSLSDPLELWSEAFTDYLQHGEKAKPISKAIWTVVNEEYMDGKLEKSFMLMVKSIFGEYVA